MKKHFIFACISLACSNSWSQTIISTDDIVRYWEAFDRLKAGGDSVAVFQEFYIDKASPGLKKFINSRNFTAEEYVRNIRAYPRFWASIRPNTMRIVERKAEIETIFQHFKQRYPAFKQPKICFAIGGLRSGGTTSANEVLIGSEIAAADANTDKSEMRGWLKAIIGTTGDIVAMVAHETVHTQQKISLPFIIQSMHSRTMAQCIREGAADFVSHEISKTNINPVIYAYGEANYQALKAEFQNDYRTNAFRKWLYNGSQSNGRPSDLGYFMGYKICEAYYTKATDKAAALKKLMRTKNPKKIMRQGEFWKES